MQRFITRCLTMEAMVGEMDGGMFSAADDSLYRPVTLFRSAGGILERPRLNAAFARARRHRITLVSGSCGAGKSTAIDAYAKLISGATATYVPDAAATELLSFARGLVTALQGTDPALSHGLVAAFSNARRTQRPPATLAQWFADRLESEDMTIILDDLHVVAESDDIAEFVAAVIDNCATRVRWILGVRSSAKLPVAGWLAGELVDLHIDDTELAFTTDEAVALAARVPVDQNRALETFAFAGSHAGCLALALLSESDSGSRSGFEDALELSITSLLRRLRPEYLRAVHSLLEAPSLEDDFVQRIPFSRGVLEQLGAEAPYAFRFPAQPRFTSAFTRIAKRVSPASEAVLAEAAHVAVGALEDAQQPAEATRIATSTGNAQAILVMLERYGFALLNRGYADIVNFAVRSLRPEERRENFIALTLEAMRESDLGRHDVADAWFAHAAKIAPDRLARARVQYIYGSDLLRRGRLDCIETLEAITAEETDAELQASATAALGAAYVAAGRWSESRNCITRALSRIDDVADVAVRAMVYHRAAFVAFRDHDADAAERYAGLALSLAEEHGHDETAIAALTMLCFVAVNYRDDVVAGLRFLEGLEACAVRLGSAFWRRYALLALIDLQSSRGAWREVDLAQEALNDEELENDVQHAEEVLLPSKALRLARSGNFAGAYHTIEGRAERQVDERQSALWWSEIAVYAISAGSCESAAAAVKSARTLLRRLSLSEDAMAVRAQLNLALASLLLGNTRSAARLLIVLEKNIQAFPRLSRFHALLSAMLKRQRGARNHQEVLDLLEALHESGLGGVAMMIEAIPYGRFTLERAS